MLEVGDIIYNKDNHKFGIIYPDVNNKLKFSNNNLKKIGVYIFYYVQYNDSNNIDCVSLQRFGIQTPNM